MTVGAEAGEMLESDSCVGSPDCTLVPESEVTKDGGIEMLVTPFEGSAIDGEDVMILEADGAEIDADERRLA